MEESYTVVRGLSELRTDRGEASGRAEQHRWILLAAVGIALNVAIIVAMRPSWNVDFNQFYSAGKLVGTGNLYNWNVMRALQLERLSEAVPFVRFPFFALALHPLALLPYSAARIVWLIAEIAALSAVGCLWPFPRRGWAAAAVCWSAPAAVCLALGQDTVFLLFVVALGIRLFLGGNRFWAGIVLSLCCDKPHLALLLPVLFAARAQWRVLLGGLSGSLAIVGLSFAAEGKEWMARLAALSRIPEFDPAGPRMPNFRGLVSFLENGLWLELLLTGVVVLLMFRLSRRLPVPAGCALALAGGLQIGHHGYVYDAVLLIPALLLAFEADLPEWMRNWSLILLTPLPHLFLVANLLWVGHVVASGYVLMLFVELARRGLAPGERRKAHSAG